MPNHNEPLENLYGFSAEELRANDRKREEVFRAMLARLENAGQCRSVFHNLALALFNDDLR